MDSKEPPNGASPEWVRDEIVAGRATHFIFSPDSSPIVPVRTDSIFASKMLVVGIMLLIGWLACAVFLPGSINANVARSLALDYFVEPDPPSAWAQPETVLQRMLCDDEEDCTGIFFKRTWEKGFKHWPQSGNYNFRDLAKCTELLEFLIGLKATSAAIRGQPARNEEDIRVTNNR
jgi:hypothetical protein